MFKQKKLKLMMVISSIALLLSTIGLIGYIIGSRDSVCEMGNNSASIKLWYEQLPQSHWLKQDDLYETNKYDIQMLDLLNSLKGEIVPLFDFAFSTLEQEDSILGGIANKKYNTEKKQDLKQYILRDNKGNKINRKFSLQGQNSIKLSVKQSKQLSFYYKKEQLMFDCNSYEFTEIMYGDGNLRNKFVFSYVENPNIVTIFNGKITGHKKGKTKLILNVGIYQFEYKIVVR